VDVTDRLVLLDRALDQVSGQLGRLAPEQYADPTPCPDWTVAALAEHLVVDLNRFTEAAQGQRPDWSSPAPHVEGHWPAAFDQGAAALRAAWGEVDDLDALVSMRIGDVPRSFVLDQQLAEFAVHAWDLDRATGHSGQLDEELAESALAWARQTLKPEFRGEGKPFGAEVTVPANAPATDRLAGFFGRDPDWAR
jgi:uncharacterized protein (TIGR03086 family)